MIEMKSFVRERKIRNAPLYVALDEAYEYALRETKNADWLSSEEIVYCMRELKEAYEQEKKILQKNEKFYTKWLKESVEDLTYMIYKDRVNILELEVLVAKRAFLVDVFEPILKRYNVWDDDVDIFGYMTTLIDNMLEEAKKG